MRNELILTSSSQVVRNEFVGELRSSIIEDRSGLLAPPRYVLCEPVMDVVRLSYVDHRSSLVSNQVDPTEGGCV